MVVSLDQIVANGLNLAAQYRHHRKSKPAQGEMPATKQINRTASGNTDIEEDEDDWQLDEMIEDESDSSPPHDHGSIAETSLRRPVNQSYIPLPLPIIVPQRRPGTKKRGFVRAYAPVLQDCGIDQETFLRFLKDFHRSSQASPWIGVVQLSAAIAGFAPSMIAMAVCMAVQVAATAGAEVQQRYRTNDFLGQANEELFKPAGLFAMIVTYKPDSAIDSSSSSQNGLAAISAEMVNLGASKFMEGVESSNGSVSSFTRKLKLSTVTTNGAAELPEFAPLVFPDVDALVKNKNDPTAKQKTKDFSKFLAGYMDRRAQMKFADENPDSSLRVPDSQRQMLSNGFLSKAGQTMQNIPVGLGRGSRLQHLHGRGGEEQFGPGAMFRSTLNGMGRGRGGSLGGGPNTGGPGGGLSVKRFLKEDVLYLTVVNLPSEGELASARERLGI